MKTPALLLLLTALPVLPAPLSQGERDRAMSELHATRKQFLDAVAGLTPKQWDFKPAPSAWSIAEVAEHLALAEDLIYDTVTRKILASPPQAERPAESKVTDETVLRTMPDRTTRRQAPPGITPSRRWATPRQAVEHFRDSRDRAIRYIETTSADLRAHLLEHRAVGLIDAYQWFLVDAGHTARHLLQIGEIKADPRFPRP